MKRARTRQALVDAAVELFSRKGYEQTTVADIAAAAEIGTRTFFSYFASKEEVLFPEADFRVRELLDLHLHPRLGSRYWLRRQEALGWSVRDRVRCREDLWLLGPTPLEHLRTFPLFPR